MSATTRLPAIFSSITLLSSAVALSVSPSLRSHVIPAAVRGAVPAQLTTYLLRLVAALLVLLNAKNIPTAWHIRVLRAIFHQLYLSPAPLRRQHLFAPLVIRTWNSPLDCDYNLHKSNSTYFADLDVARAHYVGALIRTGLRRLNAGDREGLSEIPAEVKDANVKGGFIIALGGVACTFRKEIKPLARFEIWTRLLSWDDKWLYIVSHIVRPGAIKPKSWHLQPWKAQRQPLLGKIFGRDEKATDGELRSAVYATSVAKYVCKKGRRTVAPEVLLSRSRLLPAGPRPTPLSLRDASEPASGADTPILPAGVESAGPGMAEVFGEPQGDPQTPAPGEMTWEMVETMRLRGLKFATMFDGLAGLHDEFGAQSEDRTEEVLGEYGDLIY